MVSINFIENFPPLGFKVPLYFFFFLFESSMSINNIHKKINFDHEKGIRNVHIQVYYKIDFKFIVPSYSVLQ